MTCKSNLYFCVLFIFGILYIFITPPFQVPDSQAHFYRAYQVSQGDLIAEKRGDRTGGEIPISLQILRDEFGELIFNPLSKTSLNKIIQTFDIKLNFNEKEFLGFENSAVFSPIPYLPAAIGITAASLVSDSALVSYYVAGISTLIIGLLILRLAMGVLPEYRTLIFIFSLVPIFLFELASFSSDSLSNAISMLFICLIFSVTIKQRKVDKHFVWQILITGILLALCKQTYSVLFMLTALITPQYFKNRLGYLTYQATFCFIMLLTILSWQQIVNHIYSPVHWVNGADAKLQVQNVIQHPVGLLQVIWADLARNYKNYILTMGGAVLGWSDTPLPFPVIWLNLGVLIVLSYTLNTNIKLTLWQYMMALLTIIMGIFIIELALYLHAQPVGASRIVGVHGRYFLHLAFVFLMTISTLPKFSQPNILNHDLIRKGLILTCFIPYLVSIPIIINRYYL